MRDSGLEISNGRDVIAAIPKVEDEYDLATLSEMVMELKREHPDSNDASVLLEPDIEYDHLIQVMDVVRSAELPVPEGSADEPSEDGAPRPCGWPCSRTSRSETHHEELSTHETNVAQPGHGAEDEPDVADGRVHDPGLLPAGELGDDRGPRDTEADHAARLRRRGEAARDGRDLHQPGRGHRPGRSGRPHRRHHGGRQHRTSSRSERDSPS